MGAGFLERNLRLPGMRLPACFMASKRQPARSWFGECPGSFDQQYVDPPAISPSVCSTKDSYMSSLLIWPREGILFPGPMDRRQSAAGAAVEKSVLLRARSRTALVNLMTRLARSCFAQHHAAAIKSVGFHTSAPAEIPAWYVFTISAAENQYLGAVGFAQKSSGQKIFALGSGCPIAPS